MSSWPPQKTTAQRDQRCVYLRKVVAIDWPMLIVGVATRLGKAASIADGMTIMSIESAAKGRQWASTLAGTHIFVLFCCLGILVRGEVFVLVPFVPID